MPLPYLVLLAGAVVLLLWRLVQLRAALLRARAGEARFRQLAEHSVDVGWIIDCASSELLYVSPAAQRQFGYDDAELRALVADLCVGLPERIKRFEAGDATRRQLVREFDQPHKDGRAIPVQVTSTLVADAGGRAVTLVGVVRDISAGREREQAQKRFVSMLSHEFRTPLATIDGAIQRLEATSGAADDATRKRYRKIQTAVERLLVLIDEYLSPERMAGIGRQRQVAGIAPQALLEAAVAQFNSPQHPVTLQTTALPAWLRCDPDGMRLCLQVLLDNACAYTPLGTAIELTGRPAPEGGIELCVADHGPGVPEDEISKIFDKFFRGRNAAARQGSGLGLYMARAVLDVHGGTLTLENRAEGGAAFRIWLPFQSNTGKSLAYDDCNSDNSSTQTETEIPQIQE